MKKIKIIHNRQNCIGCNSCVELAPQTWYMDEVEGKSMLIGSKKKKNLYIGDTFECDKEDNIKAAEACPVKIIKVDDVL